MPSRKTLTSMMCLGLLGATAAPKDVRLWRIDCGRIVVQDLDEFSDTRAYVGRRAVLVASCYLIRHGDDWMLWDTGLPNSMLHAGNEVARSSATPTIVDQLARLGLGPDRIGTVGISHYHYDHVGQAAQFAQARLLIGSRDADVIRADAELAEPLRPWFAGSSKLDPVSGDRDVFGDGRVVMLDLPGHTPGHHGLLVRLAHRGAVILSGDTAHFRANYASDGVPAFNTDRAESLASLNRLKGLVANLHAILIIQHDPRDVARLPAFPRPAD